MLNYYYTMAYVLFRLILIVEEQAHQTYIAACGISHFQTKPPAKQNALGDMWLHLYSLMYC